MRQRYFTKKIALFFSDSQKEKTSAKRKDTGKKLNKTFFRSGNHRFAHAAFYAAKNATLVSRKVADAGRGSTLQIEKLNNTHAYKISTDSSVSGESVPSMSPVAGQEYKHAITDLGSSTTYPTGKSERIQRAEVQIINMLSHTKEQHKYPLDQTIVEQRQAKTGLHSLQTQPRVETTRLARSEHSKMLDEQQLTMEGMSSSKELQLKDNRRLLLLPFELVQGGWLTLLTPGRQQSKPSSFSSEFKNQLRERRKIRLIYGELSKRQLERVLFRARQQLGATRDNLILLLESRLDVVLQRCAFFMSIKTARQAILHGKIKINSKLVKLPGYQLKPGDIISVIDAFRIAEIDETSDTIATTETRWLQGAVYSQEEKEQTDAGFARAKSALSSDVQSQPQTLALLKQSETLLTQSKSKAPRPISSSADTYLAEGNTLYYCILSIVQKFCLDFRAQGWQLKHRTAFSMLLPFEQQKRVISVLSGKLLSLTRPLLGIAGEDANKKTKVSQSAHNASRSKLKPLIESRTDLLNIFRNRGRGLRDESLHMRGDLFALSKKGEGVSRSAAWMHASILRQKRALGPLLPQQSQTLQAPFHITGASKSDFESSGKREHVFSRALLYDSYCFWLHLKKRLLVSFDDVSFQARARTLKSSRFSQIREAHNYRARDGLFNTPRKQTIQMYNEPQQQINTRCVQAGSKILHLEISYQNMCAIFLYPPQRVSFPLVLDLDLIIRSL